MHKNIGKTPKKAGGLEQDHKNSEVGKVRQGWAPELILGLRYLVENKVLSKEIICKDLS